MRILLIDACFGVTTNRLLGALLGYKIKINEVKNGIKKINFGNTKIKFAVKNYKNGKILKISSNYKAKERKYLEIKNIIEKSKLNRSVKKKLLKIYKIIAKAESKMHKTSIANVHFHEIGKLDNLAKIVTILIALEKLKIKKIFCSKINVGSGFVNTAHGKLPVPAPATKEILNIYKLPFYKSKIKKELVTPSSAAILKVIVDEFYSDHKPLATSHKLINGYEEENKYPVKLQIFNR